MKGSHMYRIALITTVLLLVPLSNAKTPPRQDNGRPGGYHIIKRYTLGGEGGWDYLNIDPDSKHLFLSRGDRVMVVDADSGKVLTEIKGTDGVHGIALAPELNRGFTSNGRSSSVTIFDLKSFAVLQQVKVTGQGPDAIVYDPASKHVFTFNGHSNNATAIDATNGSVVGTVDLGGRPEFAVSDGKGHIYNNVEDKSQVVEIDSNNLKVTNRWPLAPCEGPSGMAIDVEHRRLFSGCDNQMMAVMNADDGHVVATPAIGKGVDANAFDPDLGYAFSSNGQDGTLTIVHEDSPDKFTVVGNLPTQRGARTMALDTKTHRVYLVTARFGPRPAATPGNPRRWPPVLPNTFVLLVAGR